MKTAAINLAPDTAAKRRAGWLSPVQLQGGQKPAQSKAKRGLLFRAGKCALWVFLFLFLVRTFIGEASVVPTASMEGTILVGDHLFWNKALYGPEIPLVHWRLPALKTVHRGDII